MSFLKKCWALFLNAAEDKEVLSSVWEDLQEENRRSLFLYSLLAAVLFFALTVASFFSEVLNLPHWAFGASSFLMVILSLLCKYFVPTHKNSVMFFIFVFKVVIFIFGTAVSLFHADHPAVTIVALLFVSPMMFFQLPYILTLIIFAVVACFLTISHSVKAPDVWALDFWNCLSFAILSAVMSANLMYLKVKALYQSKRNDYLSRTDLLTGTKNRNCYEKDIKKYRDKTFVCVFADVNGLHEMNNTQGHEAGDVMLQKVAEQLIESFGRDEVYRIGGDEFVAISDSLEREQVEARIQEVVTGLEKQKVYVAIGYAFSTGEDSLVDVQKSAEDHMYRVKRAFYEMPEHNRRRRR